MYSPESFVAISIILPLLGLAAVLVRVYVRTRLRPGNIGADDHLIVAGCLLVCVTTVLTLIGTFEGDLGRHTTLDGDGSPILDHRTTVTLKVIYVQDIVEKLAYGFIKLSVLVFYRRIFVTHVTSTLRIATDAMIVLVALWALSLFITEIFACGVHPEVFWSYHDSVGRDAVCVNTSMVLLFFAITDVLGDLLIIAMPLRCVWQLHKTLREKIGLAGIFSLGLLSTIAGTVRLAFVVEAYLNEYGEAGDIVGSTNPPFMWTVIESSVGVLAACLPALAPLLTARRARGTIHLDNNSTAASHDKSYDSRKTNSVTSLPQPDQVHITSQIQIRHSHRQLSDSPTHADFGSPCRENPAMSNGRLPPPSQPRTGAMSSRTGSEGKNSLFNGLARKAPFTPYTSFASDMRGSVA